LTAANAIGAKAIAAKPCGSFRHVETSRRSAHREVVVIMSALAGTRRAISAVMRNAIRLSVRKQRFRIPVSHAQVHAPPSRPEALAGRGTNHSDRHVPALAKPTRGS
jgi:hypothetical protein